MSSIYALAPRGELYIGNEKTPFITTAPFLHQAQDVLVAASQSTTHRIDLSFFPLNGNTLTYGHSEHINIPGNYTLAKIRSYGYKFYLIFTTDTSGVKVYEMIYRPNNCMVDIVPHWFAPIVEQTNFRVYFSSDGYNIRLENGNSHKTIYDLRVEIFSLGYFPDKNTFVFPIKSGAGLQSEIIRIQGKDNDITSKRILNSAGQHKFNFIYDPEDIRCITLGNDTRIYASDRELYFDYSQLTEDSIFNI